MGTRAQKKRLMNGHTVEEARPIFARVLRILLNQCNPEFATLAEAKTDEHILERFWGVAVVDGLEVGLTSKATWVLMEAWYKLRAHGQNFDLVVQAFAEKIARANAHARKLELRISEQRKQIAALEKALREKRPEKPETAITVEEDGTVGELKQQLGQFPDGAKLGPLTFVRGRGFKIWVPLNGLFLRERR